MGRGDDTSKGWTEEARSRWRGRVPPPPPPDPAAVAGAARQALEDAARRATASDHEGVADAGERRSPADLTKMEILIAALAYGAGFGVVGGAIVVAYLVASS